MAIENSKVNIDFTADTSKLGSKFDQFNRLINQAQSSLDKLDRAGSKPVLDNRAVGNVQQLVKDMKDLQSSMTKVAQSSQQISKAKANANNSSGRKNTNKRSTRNRNAENNIKLDDRFSTQLANQLSEQIGQAIDKATNNLNNYQSGQHYINAGRNQRGQLMTNQSYVKYAQSREANRSGTQFSNQQRSIRTEAGKYITQADRSIRAINDNGGRITAQARKSYDRKMNSLGDYLGPSDDKGVSQLRRTYMDQQDEINKQGEAMSRRATELGNKGSSRTGDESKELATLKVDLEQNVKKSNAITDTIAQTEKLEAKFQELARAEKDITEVTPSRRSAFMTYAGVGAVRGMMSQGEQILQSQQPDTRSISASTGLFNSYQVRKQAEQAGINQGISGTEMLANENAYIEGAGNRSNRDTEQAGVRTGLLSRLTGATADESRSITSTYASSVNGADSKGLQQFQQVFEGAMSKSGMAKYGASQVKALDSLLSQVSRNNGGALSQRQAEDLANTQGLLASSGKKELQGQAGANNLSTIDSAIRNGGTNPMIRTQMLMSNPDKFGNGIGGWANQQFQLAQGASPENLKMLFGDKARGSGIGAQMSDKEYAAMIGTNLGINPQTALDIQKQMKKNGGKQLTNKQLEKAGITFENGRYEQRSGSFDQRNDINDASQEQASAQVGEWTKSIKAMVGSTIIATGSLGAFNVAIRGAITALEAVAPLKAGRAVASGIAGAKSGNRYSKTRPTDVNGNRLYGKEAEQARANNTSFVQTGAGEGTVRNKGNIDVVERVHSGSGISGPEGVETSSQPTSWTQRASERVNNGGGKLGNKIRNTTVGGKLASGATTVLNSTAMAKGTNALGKATSGARNVMGKISKNPVVSKIGQVGSGIDRTLGRALPFLPAVMEGTQAVADKQNRGSHIGGMIGSTVGTVAGGLTGNPLLAMAASMGGQWVGNKVGGLFDNQSKRKDDEATTQKKSAIEAKREKNIKSDSALTDRQLRLANKKGSKSKDDDGGSRESTTSASPFADSIEDNNKSDDDKKQKAKEKSKTKNTSTKSGDSDGGLVKMLVSGTINHTGTVADTSQLEAQTNDALNRLLTTPNANEMTRA